MIGKKLRELLDDEFSAEVEAAVLVPIKDCEDPKLVMIKRGKNLTRSSGQVAFPGGMREDGESPVETALREAREELGIRRAEVLGYLNPTMVMAYEIWICPVVGIIYDLNFEPDGYEVSRVLVDRLKNVLKSRRVTDWGATFYCDGELVWGASSRVLDDLYMRIVSRYGSVDAFFH
ncbi:MAG: CoA pyrophosphatase [Archaeoglobaceae archaeon]